MSKSIPESTESMSKKAAPDKTKASNKINAFKQKNVQDISSQIYVILYVFYSDGNPVVN